MNLLTNGSFEGPHTSQQGGTAAPDWFITGPSPDLNRAFGTGTDDASAGHLGATDGDDWVWMGSNASLDEGFGQTLAGGALTTGATYQFSMDVEPGIIGGTPNANDRLEFRDQDGNTLGFYAPPDWGSNVYTNWSFDFVAPPGVTGVEIISVGATNTTIWAMDNAMLTQVCFTPGALISTKRGDVPVETLEPGDMVLTRDNGFQELAWIYQKDISAAWINANKSQAPIHFDAGFMGSTHPLMLSPGHLVLMPDTRGEVLVPARQLINSDKAHIAKPVDTAYIHLLFESHQIVRVNGMWSESFQPSLSSLTIVGEECRREIFAIFPELQTYEGLGNYNAARDVLRRQRFKYRLVG